MARSSLATWLLLGTLSIGYAIVHIVAVCWGITLIEPFVSVTQISSSAQITQDGEVIIQQHIRRAGSHRYETIYSSLDGEIKTPAEAARLKLGNITSLVMPRVGTTDSLLPGRWGSRIAPLRDDRTPVTYWYLISPPDSPGRIYLAGYNSESHLLVGYLDMKGLSLDRPPVDVRFPVSPAYWDGWSGAVESNWTNYWPAEGYEPQWTSNNNTHHANLNGVRVWILSGEVIYEVDPSTRKTRQLMKVPKALSLRHSEFQQDGRSFWQLLVRTPDELRILDPTSLAETRLPLLPSRPDFRTEVSYLQVNQGQHIVLTQFYPKSYRRIRSTECEIQWFHPDGRLARTVSKTLPASEESSEISRWALAAIFPSPVVPLLGIGLAPNLMAQEGDSRDYIARLNEVVQFVSIWLLIALAIGLACGYACRRREVQIYGNRSWLWPIIVGLCGWFGWIGYICVRPLPARLPDGTYLPRIPEPALATGYEILA